jgi:hypothetical protein
LQEREREEWSLRTVTSDRVKLRYVSLWPPIKKLPATATKQSVIAVVVGLPAPVGGVKEVGIG